MPQQRVDIGVEALFRGDGQVIPRAVIAGGRRFGITKINAVKSRCPPGIACVNPLEYTVVIDGVSKKLYYEKTSGLWFSVRSSGACPPAERGKAPRM